MAPSQGSGQRICYHFSLLLYLITQLLQQILGWSFTKCLKTIFCRYQLVQATLTLFLQLFASLPTWLTLPSSTILATQWHKSDHVIHMHKTIWEFPTPFRVKVKELKGSLQGPEYLSSSPLAKSGYSFSPHWRLYRSHQGHLLLLWTPFVHCPPSLSGVTREASASWNCYSHATFSVRSSCQSWQSPFHCVFFSFLFFPYSINLSIYSPYFFALYTVQKINSRRIVMCPLYAWHPTDRSMSSQANTITMQFQFKHRGF